MEKLSSSVERLYCILSDALKIEIEIIQSIFENINEDKYLSLMKSPFFIKASLDPRSYDPVAKQRIYVEDLIKLASERRDFYKFFPKAHVIFCQVLNYDLDDYRSVLQCAELVIDITDQALCELKAIRNVRNPEKYQEILYGFKELVEEGIINLDWDKFGEFVRNPEIMSALESAADLLAQQQPELNSIVVVAGDDLDRILEETEILLSDVQKADVDQEIKEFLVARLEEITIAIRRYNLGGPTYLRKVVESNVGAILLKTSSLKKQKKVNVEFLTAAFKLVLTVGGLLDFGANVEGYLLPKGAEVIERLLPPSKSE